MAFRVGLTRDFLKPDGSLGFGDIGLALLDAEPGVEWEFLAEDTRELRAAQVRDYDAIIVLGPVVSHDTLAGAGAAVGRGALRRRLRHGGCTCRRLHRGGHPADDHPGWRAPPGGARGDGLHAGLDLHVPEGPHHARRALDDRFDYIGMGLTGRTLGLVGLGNIGRDLIALARPFGMRHIAFDPYTTPEAAAAIGVELVDLETVMRTSDVISIHCPLNDETRGLINAERLALMKPTAYLINTARGPIVDQRALTETLRERRIAGAGIDVFEREPVDPNDPILTLDNVIVAPHALCFTDEVALGTAAGAIQSVLAVARGELPRYVVNREAIDTPQFQAKLARYKE